MINAGGRQSLVDSDQRNWWITISSVVTQRTCGTSFRLTAIIIRLRRTHADCVQGGWSNPECFVELVRRVGRNWSITTAGVATAHVTAVAVTAARGSPCVLAFGAFIGFLFEFLDGLHAHAIVDARADSATVGTRIAAACARITSTLPVTPGSPFLPREHDTRNADFLAFDFPARFLFFPTLGLERAAIVAVRTDGTSMTVALRGRLHVADRCQQTEADDDN